MILWKSFAKKEPLIGASSAADTKKLNVRWQLHLVNLKQTPGTCVRVAMRQTPKKLFLDSNCTTQTTPKTTLN